MTAKPQKETPTRVHDWATAATEARRQRDGRLMAQLILNGLPRELLWKLTHGWPPPTLPADNLEDPAEHLLSIGLAEVVDGGLWATQAGYDLRARIEREELCASGRHWRPPSRAAGIKRTRAQRMSCAMSPTERK